MSNLTAGRSLSSLPPIYRVVSLGLPIRYRFYIAQIQESVNGTILLATVKRLNREGLIITQMSNIKGIAQPLHYIP